MQHFIYDVAVAKFDAMQRFPSLSWQVRCSLAYVRYRTGIKLCNNLATTRKKGTALTRSLDDCSTDKSHAHRFCAWCSSTLIVSLSVAPAIIKRGLFSIIKEESSQAGSDESTEKQTTSSALIQHRRISASHQCLLLSTSSIAPMICSKCVAVAHTSAPNDLVGHCLNTKSFI